MKILSRLARFDCPDCGAQMPYWLIATTLRRTTGQALFSHAPCPDCRSKVRLAFGDHTWLERKLAFAQVVIPQVVISLILLLAFAIILQSLGSLAAIGAAFLIGFLVMVVVMSPTTALAFRWLFALEVIE